MIIIILPKQSKQSKIDEGYILVIFLKIDIRMSVNKATQKMSADTLYFFSRSKGCMNMRMMKQCMKN